MSEQRFGSLADRYARQYGVPPKLFRLLISAESSWNPNAVSGAGARGLTQVVPRWHPGANLSTPQGQLEYGAKHLGSLLKKYGNPRDALAVYNSGRPWAQSQNISETRNYVTKILGQLGSGGGPVPPSGGESPAGPPPGGGASPPSGGSGIDARALMQALKASREGVLQGQAPGKSFGRNLHGLVSRALANPVRVQPSGGGHAGHDHGAMPDVDFSGFSMGGGPEAHHSRALGNWQSDDAYDLMGKAGDPVPAFTSGVVTKISGKPGGDPGFAGYGITVRTPQGDFFYKHLGTANVKVGQKVTPQTILGTLDAKTAGGPHLHLGGTNREFLSQLARLYTRGRR